MTMDAKDHLVTCPCCESRLVVDARTGKLVRWSKKGEADESGKPILNPEQWSQASERVKGRLDAATDRFDQNLSREKTKSKELDELFRRASEKLQRPPD